MPVGGGVFSHLCNPGGGLIPAESMANILQVLRCPIRWQVRQGAAFSAVNDTT